MRFTELISRFYNKINKPLLIIIFFAIFIYIAYHAFQSFQAQSEAKVPDDIANDLKRNSEVGIFLFAADWCNFCKKAAPVWEAFVNEYNGKNYNDYRIVCKKIDCTNNKGESKIMADRYKVEKFPTIIMIKDGKIYDFEANVTKEHLETFLRTFL